MFFVYIVLIFFFTRMVKSKENKNNYNDITEQGTTAHCNNQQKQFWKAWLRKKRPRET